MKTTRTVIALSLLLASLLGADTLRLKSGTKVDGTYLGGDTRQIKFLQADGGMKTFSVADVDGIDFTTETAPAAAAPTPPAPVVTPVVEDKAIAPKPPLVAASTPAPAPVASHSTIIPAGTVVSVRMIDSIDTDVAGAGERFRASIDDPVVIDGNVLVPRGADATVQVMRVEQSGKISGSDEIAMKLYDISYNGKTYETATNYAEVQGEGQGKKTAKTTAVTTGVGAVLGAIIGGGKGAAIGAGAGAATGVAVSAARGKTLRIPSETRLDFELRAPLAVN